MSDFEAVEEIPFDVVQVLRKHPAFADLYEGEKFYGTVLYYERITEDNGDVWHLVVMETEEGITQLGVDEATLKMQFFHPISINEIRFYSGLSEKFRTQILLLSNEIYEEEDVHESGGHAHHSHHHH